MFSAGDFPWHFYQPAGDFRYGNPRPIVPVDPGAIEDLDAALKLEPRSSALENLVNKQIQIEAVDKT